MIKFLKKLWHFRWLCWAPWDTIDGELYRIDPATAWEVAGIIAEAQCE